MKSFVICSSHQNSIQVIKLRGMEMCWVMWHMWDTGEAPTGFWWGNLEETTHKTRV